MEGGAVERNAAEHRQREQIKNDESVTVRGKAAASKDRKEKQSVRVQRQLKPLAEQLLPHLGTAQKVLLQVEPYLELAGSMAMELYGTVTDKVDPDWLLVTYGLVLCFFGGHYVALIAAIEAFGMSGWEVVHENTLVCWEQAKVALEAVEADDHVDADGDGIADVKQIAKDELVMRKIRVVMLAVDPARVMTASGHLYVAFVAMIATLQIRFAKVVTLGLSIAELLAPLVDKTVVPTLQNLTPQEYHRWIIVGIKLVVKSVACSLAWLLQTVISAVQSASRGGLIIARAALRLANKHGYTDMDHEETLLDEFAGWGLALFGFFFQLSFGFGIPFPVSLVLWPASVVEYFLRWIVVNN